MTELHLGLCLA